MRRRRVKLVFLLGVLLALLDPSESVVADPRNSQVVEKLRYIATAADMTAANNLSVTAVANETRGGNNSGIPVGCYHLGCPRNRIFSSDYVHENVDTIVSWAYDLYAFLDNHQVHDTNALVPYKAVRAFADQWWNQNSPAFKQRSGMHRSTWIYEAILDGLQIWASYEMLDGISSTNSLGYFDIAIAKYGNASATEIFFTAE